jgi:hypothetical protein
MIVWKSKLDNKFDVMVVRKDNYSGVFSVSLNDNVLYQTDVSLSYGATFGCDIDDVGQWMQMGIDFIDGPSCPIL